MEKYLMKIQNVELNREMARKVNMAFFFEGDNKKAKFEVDNTLEDFDILNLVDLLDAGYVMNLKGKSVIVIFKDNCIVGFKNPYTGEEIKC